MANVNCTVYFRENGSSKIYTVSEAKGRLGSYGIRWYEGKRQRQKIIGTYPAASAAKLRKELDLKKASRKTDSTVAPEELVKLDAAIETFLREREDLSSASAKRWKIELDLFKEQSGKEYISQLTREDVFAYRKWYKDHGRSDNTVALRTSSLFTFGIGRISNEDEPLPVIAYRIFVVFAAVAALYLGQKIVARDRATLNWSQCVIAFALVSAGIFVLVVSAIRLLR